MAAAIHGRAGVVLSTAASVGSVSGWSSVHLPVRAFFDDVTLLIGEGIMGEI